MLGSVGLTSSYFVNVFIGQPYGKYNRVKQLIRGRSGRAGAS